MRYTAATSARGLTGSADFDVYHDLTLGVGGEYRNTDRKGTDREVMSETLTDGFGRILFRPDGLPRVRRERRRAGARS